MQWKIANSVTKLQFSVIIGSQCRNEIITCMENDKTMNCGVMENAFTMIYVSLQESLSSCTYRPVM